MQLDRQGLAPAIDAVADGQTDPAFRDAVFLDIGLVLALEADADALGQQVSIVEWAVGVDAQAVGKDVGHGDARSRRNGSGFSGWRREVQGFQAHALIAVVGHIGKAPTSRSIFMIDQPAITVDGHAIPLLGFGTWNLTPEVARTMVAEALRIGYRHIDTAWIYQNEAAVGDGIRDAIAAGHVERKDVWLTTKIWVAHFDRDGLLKQARESAASLGFTPDLLLLHWPKAEPAWEETLGALNQALDTGLTRTIGLSNFPSAEFRRAQALSKAKLVTNQVEYHPYLKLSKLKTTAKDIGSSLTAWSPLAQGAVANDATLVDIGKAHGKSPGQVALRWLIQQNIIAIPRTSKVSRAEENFDIFDFRLSEEEVDRIHALARPDGRLGDWIDPAFKWDEEWA